MSHLVYAVLSESDAVRVEPPTGVEGRAVHLTPAEGLAAAHSSVSEAEAAPTVSRAAAFGGVVAALHRACTVLPFRYGCVLETQAEIIELLGNRGAEFASALDALSGCVEMTVRLLLPDARQADAAAPSLADAASGRAYLSRRRAGYGEADRLSRREQAAESRLRGAVHRLVRGCRRECVPANQARLLTFHFLIQRSALGAFCHALGALPGRDREALLLTGPWPPYNFARFHGTHSESLDCETTGGGRRTERGVTLSAPVNPSGPFPSIA